MMSRFVALATGWDDALVSVKRKWGGKVKDGKLSFEHDKFDTFLSQPNIDVCNTIGSTTVEFR